MDEFDSKTEYNSKSVAAVLTISANYLRVSELMMLNFPFLCFEWSQKTVLGVI